MTSRDRLVASLRLQPVDRFFRFEQEPHAQTLARWRREGYPEGSDFASFFGMDPFVRLCANAADRESPFFPLLRGQTPAVAGPADWTKVKESLRVEDTPERVGDVSRVIRACADPTVPTILPACGAFRHTRNLFGDDGLSRAVRETPALIEDVLDNWLGLYAELIRRLARHVQVDVLVLGEDLCAESGMRVTVEMFRTLWMPRCGELARTAKDYGVEGIVVDTGGDCRPLLRTLLECGVDAVMPMEVRAGMDAIKIRREFPTLCIVGGLDGTALAGPPDGVEAEVDRVLKRFPTGDGGFIPSLDRRLTAEIPLAGFQHYLECVREYE